VVLGCVLLLGAAPAALAETSSAIGVHDVEAYSRVTATRSDVIVTWRPATAAQQRGLSWTSVYFGREPQPILVFSPTIHDVTIPDVAPGTYRITVEFAYGPRSNFTYTSPGRTTVTVVKYVAAAGAPTAPTRVAAAVSGHRVTVTWTPDRSDAADHRATSYVVSVGGSRVTVVHGYAASSATVTNVPTGRHDVTVTARNGAGESSPASGEAVRVARRRGAQLAAERSDGGSWVSLPILAGAGLLVVIAGLVFALYRER